MFPLSIAKKNCLSEKKTLITLSLALFFFFLYTIMGIIVASRGVTHIQFARQRSPPPLLFYIIYFIIRYSDPVSKNQFLSMNCNKVV